MLLSYRKGTQFEDQLHETGEVAQIAMDEALFDGEGCPELTETSKKDIRRQPQSSKRPWLLVQHQSLFTMATVQTAQLNPQ